jgi:transcriptional regulator with XRE-family HTH domain
MQNLGNKEVFAKNLAYYLERSGKEQKEVARIIGVAPSTFNEWVRGKKFPRIEKIEALAKFFGILKSDLIEDPQDVPAPQLTEAERYLLELFRQIPEERQRVFLDMGRVYTASLDNK